MQVAIYTSICTQVPLIMQAVQPMQWTQIHMYTYEKHYLPHKSSTNCARYSSSITYLQYFFVYRISCLSLDISLPLRVFALVREQVGLDVSIWKGTPSIGAG